MINSFGGLKQTIGEERPQSKGDLDVDVPTDK